MRKKGLRFICLVLLASCSLNPNDSSEFQLSQKEPNQILTVSLNYEGGIDVYGNIGDSIIKKARKGDVLELPLLSKNGWVFCGWSDGENSNLYRATVNSDMKLFALWERMDMNTLLIGVWESMKSSISEKYIFNADGTYVKYYSKEEK